MSNSLLWKPVAESLIRGDVMEKIAAEMVASAKGMSPLGALIRTTWPYGTVLRHPTFGSVMVLDNDTTVDLSSGEIETNGDYFGHGWEVVSEA